MNRQFRGKAFTLIELLVVISIIALLIGILLPALGAARRVARQMQNSTQIRGIQQSLVMFSQGNNSYYPGKNTQGAVAAATDLYDGDGTAQSGEDGYAPMLRFRELLEDNYFEGEYAVSPSETKTAWGGTGTSVQQIHISYGLLDIADAGQRTREWRDTSNSEAVVIADRAIDNNDSGSNNIKSVHTNPTKDTKEWRGSVGFNDNHVSFVATHDDQSTQYGDTTIHNDNLFNKTNAFASDSVDVTTSGGTTAVPDADNGNLAWESSISAIDDGDDTGKSSSTRP
ncbi:MAG TPA: hypothetical protein DCM28_13380 [Phycisphaerales bacterium]|nr:hypothetical protein [Phycisphaerales bacterium]HCD33848.1 hypothetical protein [Phycisphaerales bacterium]